MKLREHIADTSAVYSIKPALPGPRVVLFVEAAEWLFEVWQEGTLLKTLPIEGLSGRLLPLEQYAPWDVQRDKLKKRGAHKATMNPASSAKNLVAHPVGWYYSHESPGGGDHGGVQWNYTSVLNILFLLLAVVLVIRFLRTGGLPVLGMMNTPAHEMSRHDS